MPIWHWNITTWGGAVQDYLNGPSCRADIVLLCETHRPPAWGDPPGLAGWRGLWHPAVPSDTGKGWSAGVAVLWRSRFVIEPLRRDVMLLALNGRDDLLSRLTGAVVRMQKGSVVVLEVYLVVGMGLTGCNAVLLEALGLIAGICGLPIVAFGDFQVGAAELAEAVPVQAGGWSVVHGLGPTCFTPKAATGIDCVLLSPSASSLVTQVGKSPTLRRPHWAVWAVLETRPRSRMMWRQPPPAKWGSAFLQWMDASREDDALMEWDPHRMG